MKNRTISNLVLTFCAIIAFQTAYTQGYQRLFYDFDRDIVSTCSSPTSDGGYYMVSYFNGPSTEQPDSIGLLVARHDNKGDLTWSYDYMIDDANYSLTDKVIECSGIGKDSLLVVAVDGATSADEGKKFLLKIGPDGELIWSSTIMDKAGSANTTGFVSRPKILGGNYNDHNYFGTHHVEDIIGVHFERLDSFYTSTISNSYYGRDTMSGDDVSLSLMDAEMEMDSSFVLALATPSDLTKAAILRLDSLGVPLQAQTYKIDAATDFNLEFNAITMTPDTGYVAVGNCIHNGVFQGVAVKFDSLLNVSWARQINLEAGSFNQAHDVVVSESGEIVVAGKYFVFASASIGHYAIFLDMEGSTSRFPVKYESENSLYAELSSGLQSYVSLSNQNADMTMVMSMTGTGTGNIGLSPMVIKLGQDGAAMCHDSLKTLAIDSLTMIKDTLEIVQSQFTEMEELEVRVVNFDQFDIPVLSMQDATYCPRDTVTHIFDATTDGAVAYLWSNEDTTATTSISMASVEPGETMEVSVIVTIGQEICYTLCDTVGVSKTNFPMASVGIDTDKYCSDNTVDFIAGSSTNLAGGVIWDNLETTSRITVSAGPDNIGTTYSVTITDSCEDTAVAEATVQDLRPDPGKIKINNSELCEEGVLLLIADWSNNKYGPEFTYAWESGESIDTIRVDMPGVYTVTITDTCNPAHSTIVSRTIGDELMIPPPSIVINQSDLMSFGNNMCGIRLTAVGTIDPGAANIPDVELVFSGDVTPDQFLDVTEETLTTDPQTFTAIVTQCGEDFSTDITLTAADLDVPDLTIGIRADFDEVSCEMLLVAEPGEVAIGPSQITWSNNVLGTVSTVTDPGNYMVSLTDACGQEAVASIDLVAADFLPDAFTIVIVENENGMNEGCDLEYKAKIEDVNDDEITDLAPYDILWSTGETTQSIVTSDEGVYSVTVTNCGVSQEDNEEIEYELDFPNIFFAMSEFSLAHPINNSFGPYSDCPEALDVTYTLEIYNRWGKKVFETDRIEDRWRGTLNNQGNYLEEDVYMFQWSEDGVYDSGHVTLARSINK